MQFTMFTFSCQGDYRIIHAHGISIRPGPQGSLNKQDLPADIALDM